MRPFSAARHALLLAPLVAMSLSACGDAADDGEQATPTRGTPIRVTFGDTVITGRLRDASTAGNLAGQLPLTLASRDHNNAEKTAPLPRELTVEDAPARHDPAAGDIGYWAPGADFVLYYDDAAPYFDGRRGCRANRC